MCAAATAAPAVARLSAALVVAGAARSTGRYDYKVLFLQRSSKTSAFASFHVFPGGVVDPEDSSPAWLPLLPNQPKAMDADISLRLTAMRECFEECGILVRKLQGTGRPGRVRQQQVHKNAGTFREVMEQFSSTAECVLSLKPVARFITPNFEARRFDTTFYASSFLTEATAQHDGVETVSMSWLDPEEALAACAAGRLRLMPPQWYIMTLLAPYRTWSAAHAALPLATGAMQPEVFVGPDGPAMVLPGDESHSQPGPAGSLHRVVLRNFSGNFLTPGVTYELVRSPPAARI